MTSSRSPRRRAIGWKELGRAPDTEKGLHMGWGLAIWGGFILSGVLMVCAIIAGAVELYEKRTVFVLEPLLPDKSGAMHGRLRPAMDIMLPAANKYLLPATVYLIGTYFFFYNVLLPAFVYSKF